MTVKYTIHAEIELGDLPFTPQWDEHFRNCLEVILDEGDGEQQVPCTIEPTFELLET